MPRAAIYARLSRSTEESTSIERQVKSCRSLAESRGYTVVLVSDVDVDISGGRLSRPGLDEIRSRWSEIDVLIFFKLDRLSRSLLDFVSILDEARENGVALVSATEPLDLTSPIGEALVKVLVIFAELERQTIAFRTANATAHLRATGRATGGVLPYWLKRVLNPNGPGYVTALDADKTGTVLEIIARVQAGEGIPSIGLSLAQRGVPAPQGSRWHPNTIYYILRNPALWGAIVHKGQVVRGDDGLPVLQAALIDRAVWDDIQMELRRRSQPATRSGALRKGLLSGILICDHCGTRLQLGRSRRWYNYGCPAKTRGIACVGVTISRDQVEAYVVSRFLKKYGSWSQSLPLFFEPDDEGQAAAESEELRAVETALEDLEKDRYERGLFQGDRGAQRYTDMYRRLEMRRDALTRELERSGHRADDQEPLFDVMSMKISDWWETAGLEEQRDLLHGLLGAIRIKKGRSGARRIDTSRVSFERGLT